MVNYKYYGTNYVGFYIPQEILEKYNARNNHQQYRIVCKAKSRAEADRIVKGILNTTVVVFKPNWTSETGNVKELESCDQFTAIISLDNGYRGDYYSLEEIYKEVQEFRSQLKQRIYLKRGEVQ